MRMNDNRMKYRDEKKEHRKRHAGIILNMLISKWICLWWVWYALCEAYTVFDLTVHRRWLFLINECFISLFISSFIFFPASSICLCVAIDQMRIIHTRDAPTLATNIYIYSVHWQKNEKNYNLLGHQSKCDKMKL